MAASRVVPLIDGSPTFKQITLRWIDAVGDLRTDTSIIDATTTTGQIESLVAAMLSASNASLYAAYVTDVYLGEKSKANALHEVRESVNDNIVYHAKDPNRENRRAYVPAPISSMFIDDTEIPDENAIKRDQIMTKWDTVWKGSFAGVSLRFTERRDINKKGEL